MKSGAKHNLPLNNGVPVLSPLYVLLLLPVQSPQSVVELAAGQLLGLLLLWILLLHFFLWPAQVVLAQCWVTLTHLMTSLVLKHRSSVTSLGTEAL